MREKEERLMRQAAHVNAWDQLLQQGHDQVQQLRLTLNNVKVTLACPSHSQFSLSHENGKY